MYVYIYILKKSKQTLRRDAVVVLLFVCAAATAAVKYARTWVNILLLYTIVVCTV